MKNKTFLANCALVLCAVIWGMNFIFQKQASQHLGAFTFISLRYYLGVLSLLPLFFYMRRRKALAALEAGEEVERWHGRRFWLAALGASLANWGGAVLVQIGLHVADATKAKIYMKNFGEFFNDQVEHASAILLSRTQNMDQAKLNAAVSLLRNKNPKAAILTTPWEQLTGDQIVSAMEGGRSLAEELLEEIGHSHGGDEAHHHHHHEHHDGEGCSCGHDHHDHEHHDEHDHHGHDHCHDEAACDVCLGHEHGHEHHHDHDEAACDACCGHHHHHGHDADEVFTSWGRETPRKYSREDLQDALSALAMSEDYGYILRAKGMVPCDDGQTWLHFDLVPEEFQIREGAADYTGRLCVIGSGLDEAGLEKLFQLV